MTRRLRSRRGVTLLELLVAMSLFSLLSVGVFFSLRTGLSSLGRVRERIADSRRQAGAQRSLELMLAGISLTGAQYFEAGESTGRTAYFFQGESASMRFISNYSLQQGTRTPPQLIELAVAPHPEGGVRLLLNERRYPGPQIAGMLILGSFPEPDGGTSLRYRPIVIGPGSFVVADRLPACRFLYLERILPDGDLWRDRWRQAQLPKAIRIEMGARTVTAPVYVSISEI
jgi:prepilin-type N-terminal cleavage/methylation domain-containing protein